MATKSGIEVKPFSPCETFFDQLFQFPSPLTHDDLVDALAYIDQLAEVAYPSAFSEIEDWEALDPLTGF